jgi:hypothetical protein
MRASTVTPDLLSWNCNEYVWVGAEPELLTVFSRATSGFSARVLYQPLFGCRVLDITSFDISNKLSRECIRLRRREVGGTELTLLLADTPSD